MNMTHEQLIEQLYGMRDSVAAIERIMAENDRSEDGTGSINRNVRHLEIMLSNTNIKESGADLSEFEDSVAAGKNWLRAS